MVRNHWFPGEGGWMHQVFGLRRRVRHVARQHDDAHVMQGIGMLDGGHQHAGSLLRRGSQFRIRAAFLEQLFRMGHLEIVHPHLALGDVGGDRQHAGPAPVGIIKAIDQVKIAGAAAAAAHGQVTGQLGFRTGGKGAHLLMPHVDPFDGFFSAEGVRNGVQTVSHNAVNALYSRFFQDFNKLISYRIHAD